MVCERQGGVVIAFDQAEVVATDGTVLLHEITLSLNEQRVAIIGANGSGKTTLARLINGLTLPTGGTVMVDDLDTTADRRAVQRRVGFVFQDADHQLVYPTPIEDVALGLRARGLGKRAAREAALDVLRTMSLEHKAEQAIHTLSGGEKHLVALCAVLALEPAWIVLDEPTTTLDLVNRRRVVDALMSLSQRLVVVSHDLELVGRLDRAVLIADGTIAADGPPQTTTRAYRDLVGAP
jgi:biotin transport system ATP-binding protein